MKARYFLPFCVLLALNQAALANNEEAIKLYNEQRYKRAIMLFEDDRSSLRTDPRAAFFYARALEADGRIDSAADTYNTVIHSFPGTSFAQQAKTFLSRCSKAPIANRDIGLVGVQLSMSPLNEATIRQVLPDTPADKAHFAKGDVILRIDGKRTNGLDLNQVLELLAGKPDTVVTIELKRGEQTVTEQLRRGHSEQMGKEHPDLWTNYEFQQRRSLRSKEDFGK